MNIENCKLTFDNFEVKSPKDIQIADYVYELPDERIAKYPLAERDASKLLIYDHGHICHRHFRDLPALLPEGSLLVMNNTRVIQARLHFRKKSDARGEKSGTSCGGEALGALIEVFCLEPAVPHDYVLMFQQTACCTWHCLVGNSKKWKAGPLTRVITVEGHELTLEVQRGEGDLIYFSWQDERVTWAQILDACGELPIPPYLNRKTEQSDLTTYQTVYSKIKGSVAAPTAGLHFTPAVLADIERHGIERAELTLHVGAGTFKPVKSERMEGHTMHSEWIYVPRSVIEALLRHGSECTAVGTTSVRTLESLYYIGKRILCNPDATEEDLKVGQWEPYPEAPLSDASLSVNRPSETISPSDSLSAILSWMDRNHLDALHTSTQIIIAPGYRYHIVRRIITNFHQPQSTLLLLVAAFVGTDHWRDIYDYALANDFRFLSYGDSSLLIP